ncbi:hypothetical protein VTJ49DRAFT_319 [Mycothermus thermophilus]|uniref:Zn(2)-C6 fungal-type domain-containing protein n=1 Tax=Humicola insolens TaxID=85995 RepID=A0ABR3VGE4_HUMIN
MPTFNINNQHRQRTDRSYGVLVGVSIMKSAEQHTANGHKAADAVAAATTTGKRRKGKGKEDLPDAPNVPELSPSPTPAPPPSDTGADAGSPADGPPNPRKRKKTSRACDHCHKYHQPCDNASPRCSVCVKDNVPCTYERPIKRRGPQKGYRMALNMYKESAAAWGAILAGIPGIEALIDNSLRSAAGQTTIATIRDAAQQDALIARWQQSPVHLAIFGHNLNPAGNSGADDAASEAATAAARDAQTGADNNAATSRNGGTLTASSQPATVPQNIATQASAQRGQSISAVPVQATPTAPHQAAPIVQGAYMPPTAPSLGPVPSAHVAPPAHTAPSVAATTTTAAVTAGPASHQGPTIPSHPQRQPAQQNMSLFDIVAQDATQSSEAPFLGVPVDPALAKRASRTLASLGFAPNETLSDFYTMSANPEPIPEEATHGGDPDFDPELGTEAEQKAYYELLMGRKFPG